MHRRVSLALIALLAAVPVGGCGEPDVGGSGRLERVEGGGAGDHLILEGTPYQMGWWHGHLLKDRIRALHEEWQRQAFALDGDLMSAATKERRKAALALVEPVLQNHLPEAVRQEYQGLSDACGLPVRTLLLTEMITDLLRFTEQEPRLMGGGLHLGSGEEGLALYVAEPWTKLLSTGWLWITRRLHRGGSATVLAWPGGLGAILAARADGLVVASVESKMDAGREGLAGVPFRVSLRLACEREPAPAALSQALSRTTGHEAYAIDLSSGAGVRQLLAFTPEDPHTLSGPPRDAAADDPSRKAIRDLHRELVETATRFSARHEAGVTWLSWAVDGNPERRLRVP